jgi:hypothetical protein
VGAQQVPLVIGGDCTITIGVVAGFVRSQPDLSLPTTGLRRFFWMPYCPGGTTPIVAWHEVPGKTPSKEPSRRVRYDRAQLVPEVFLVVMCALFL